MEAPGCWQALTNSALNSGVYVRCVRRAGYLGVSDSLSMVCTICCVHTILRVGRAQFKMDSPDAYVAISSAAASLLVRDVTGEYRPADADEVLQAAQRVLAGRVRGTDVLTSPAVVKDFLRARLGNLPQEIFAVVHLDAQHRVLDYVEMFRGTVSQTSVYPREVVKDALSQNSSALLLVHNHPSGSPEPSRADEHLTQTLKSAAALVDVRVLDHLVVTGDSVLSMAERGLM